MDEFKMRSLHRIADLGVLGQELALCRIEVQQEAQGARVVRVATPLPVERLREAPVVRQRRRRRTGGGVGVVRRQLVLGAAELRQQTPLLLLLLLRSSGALTVDCFTRFHVIQTHLMRYRLSYKDLDLPCLN